jgi:cytoskeletal protein CcmA (bactofilin family)
MLKAMFSKMSCFNSLPRNNKPFMMLLERLKIQGRKQPLIIDAGLNITGEIVSMGPVMINGSFSGCINSSIDLIIGKTGKAEATLVQMDYVDIDGELEGDIEGAKQVSVRGNVRGNIQADRVIIANSGNVVGSVKTGQFRVAQGGRLEGGCIIGI